MHFEEGDIKMILFIDTAVRPNSRTRKIAQHLIDHIKGNDEVVTFKPNKDNMPELNYETLSMRGAACDKQDFSDPYFDLAKQFKSADTIVIAAPFWDLSFPASLKQYIENVTVSNLTFKYDETGHPVGLCNGKKLYYVCTAGGPVMFPEFGFGWVEGMAKGMFGIPEAVNITVEFMDVEGADEDAILAKCYEDIDKM